MLLMAIYIFLTTQLRFNISIDFVLDKKIKFSVLALLLPVFLRFIYKILLSEEKEGLAGKDIQGAWMFLPDGFLSIRWCISPPIWIIGDMRL